MYHRGVSHPHPTRNIGLKCNFRTYVIEYLSICKIRFSESLNNLQHQDFQRKGLPLHPSSFYLGMPETKKSHNSSKFHYLYDMGHSDTEQNAFYDVKFHFIITTV